MLVGIAAASPGAAQPVQVDLELVLAVDISGSMDRDEQMLQRAGYVAAFRDKSVVDAMLDGPSGRIAVTYLEWANQFSQQQLIPWTVIQSPADAEAVAAALEAAPYSTYHGTSISGALLTASQLIDSAGYHAAKRVIDVSGDGANNNGPELSPVRAATMEKGIVINGLPIVLHAGRSFYDEDIDLEAYYRENVIAGPGSFVIAVREPGMFSSSIRSKMIQEVAGAERAEKLALGTTY
jgi:hypothetical protein